MEDTIFISIIKSLVIFPNIGLIYYTIEQVKKSNIFHSTLKHHEIEWHCAQEALICFQDHISSIEVVAWSNSKSPNSNCDFSELRHD